MLNGETIDQSLTSKFDCECSYDTTSYDNGTGVIPSYLLTPTVVTKDNIQTALIDTGYYTMAAALGLPESVRVCAGAGDNAAAAVGTGTVGDGRCNISLGTSGTIFISSRAFGVDPNNALHAFAHADGNYHLMGCMPFGQVESDLGRVVAGRGSRRGKQNSLEHAPFAADADRGGDDSRGRVENRLPDAGKRPFPGNSVDGHGVLGRVEADLAGRVGSGGVEDRRPAVQKIDRPGRAVDGQAVDALGEGLHVGLAQGHGLDHASL